ncbi:MAG: hypothetical protein M1813_008319 [Trichoglossum hirsutum]|nr:MAG: hypothetical protein M1813_008319 [Trichoglossum hirsutum]
MGNSGIQSPRSSSQLWRPGLQNTPWLAVAMILIAVACLIASTIIIVVSDNQPVPSWRVQPAVLLAIISSISHLALGFAISDARTIIWWRNALRRTTIGQLYYLWNPIEHWRNLTSAISSGIDYKKIFITTIIVSIANLATAPLFQRATYVQNSLVTKGITLEIEMVERILAADIGEVDDIPLVNLTASAVWGSVSREWNADIPILMPSHSKRYCDGRCEGNIRAIGVITNCSSTTRSVDLSEPINNGTTIFGVNITRGEDHAHIPTLAFIATYAVAINNSTCIATITDETCDTKVANVQYPIVVENRTITLNSDKYPNTGESEPYTGDFFNASQGSQAGALGGLGWSLANRWMTFSNLFQFLDPKTNTTIYYPVIVNPSIINQYTIYSNENTTSTSNCAISFNPPTNDIVRSLPQMLFRAGLFLATPNNTRNISLVQTTPTLIYQSEYSWFAIAIAIMAIATFSCIIPLWGWWELGRKVTLNPIETAKAFNVPRLRMADSGCSAEDIVKNIGDLQVEYIQVQVQDAAGNSLPSMELRPVKM